MAAQSCTSIARASAFARAARRYWLNIFPCARAELKYWRRRAEQIPDRILREAALDALITKGDVLEGATAFVVLSPPSMHSKVIRAITAFEIAFDYLDTIVELPNHNPIANGHSLGQALLTAFEPRSSHPNYYEHHAGKDDAGYLEALVDTCRTCMEELPSFTLISESARRALSRIVRYQCLNHGHAHSSDDAFAQWARSHVVAGTDLRWWETGAAVGSQLMVLALIAAAADPGLQVEGVAAIEHAYFPWIGALSTLLDSVVDQHADKTDNEQSLVDYYCSPQITAERLRLIALEAQRAVMPLADAANHFVILAAMAAFFHSAPQASTPEIRLSTRAVLKTMGGCAVPALLFFRTRRVFARKTPNL